MAAGNRFGPVCGNGRELDGACVGLGRREWLVVDVDVGEHEHEHEHVNEHEYVYDHDDVYVRDSDSASGLGRKHPTVDHPGCPKGGLNVSEYPW